jgi:hypothetical protein
MPRRSKYNNLKKGIEIKVPRTYRKRGEDIVVKRQQSRWTRSEKKAQVVTAYLTLGNSRMVEAATGIKAGTVRVWKTTDWWKDMEAVIRDEENLALDVKLSAIVGKTLDLLDDRVTHGDFLYDPKKGQLIRKPLNAHVANKVLSDTFDRRQVLRRKNVEENINATRPEDFLLRLASEFVKIARGTQTSIDVEVVPLKEIEHAKENGRSIEEASSQETPEQGKNGGLRVWNSQKIGLETKHSEKGEITNEQSPDSQDRGSRIQGSVSNRDQGAIDGGSGSRSKPNPGIPESESGDDKIQFTP